MGMNDERQYTLDYTSRRAEVLSLIASLHHYPLAVDGVVLSPGRRRGVVEILQRLILLSREATNFDSIGTVAQVVAIAARISDRPTASERTVQRWRRDAEALGLLHVACVSQHYGGRYWNQYTVDVAAVQRLLEDAREGGVTRGDTGRHGVTWGDTVSGPGGDTVSGPRPDTMSGPLIDNLIDNQAPTRSTTRHRVPPARGADPPAGADRCRSVGRVESAQDVGTRDGPDVDPAEWRLMANRVAHAIRGPAQRAMEAGDLQLSAKVAWLVLAGRLPEDAVQQALESLSLSRPANRAAWLTACLRNHSRERGEVFGRLMAAAPELPARTLPVGAGGGGDDG